MNLIIEVRTKQELLFRCQTYQSNWIQFYRWSDGNVKIGIPKSAWPGVTLSARNQKSLMLWLEWSSK